MSQVEQIRSGRRRFFVPETIQTSAMDCGPASLKSLLSGFGIKTSYGRLREACHTSVDGSSIDNLEDLANALGLDADQEMMPAEHVLAPAADCLPALVVTRLPTGLSHFEVLWRMVGPWVQVMDPGRGRRWIKRAAVESSLYIHETQVDAADVAAWLASPAFLDPLRARLRRLSGRARAQRLIDEGTAIGWAGLAALDAAARATRALIVARAVGERQAARVLALLLASTGEPEPCRLIPEALWTVRRGRPTAAGERIVVRGAIVLKVNGRQKVPPALPTDLGPVVRAVEEGAGRHLLNLVRQGGLGRLVPLALGLLVAGLGSVLETLLFRGAFDVGNRLELFEQRALAGLALLALLLGLSLLEWPIGRGLWAMGSRLEMGLRRAFLQKLPRLGDRYFQSRPLSSMAETSHLLHWLRLLPGQGGQLIRCIAQLVATGAGVIWLCPSSAPLVILLGVLMVALPFLCQPVLLEQDLRMRGHAGGLARFYLDALLGLSAIRAHTAEGAVIAEHGSRLREWARSARDVARTATVIETAIVTVGYGLAAAVVLHYLTHAEGSGWAILLVYWALMMPALGMELALLVQQYPQHRSVTLRLLEPLGAAESASDEGTIIAEPPGTTPTAAAPALGFHQITVEQAGNLVLSVPELVIAGGEHVALVGVSGAGKSSLVGLLLGWYPPDTGKVVVDGLPLLGAELARLRRATVWVDPTVQLWNRSLLENLRYGTDQAHKPLGDAVEAAELDEVLARLPMGLQTSVGANGALLSGGEGQRVRLARGIGREQPRLVILDEAFCGLERARRSSLLAAARVRWQSATLLCITHDIADTLSFSRVLVIEEGRVIEDGIPAALAALADSRYARLLAAEKRALARLTGARWRRFRVESGEVTADPAPRRPGEGRLP